MAGIAIDITSNAREIVERLERARLELRPALENALAEQAIAFNQDLRGPGPGQGLTPFDTGRLLTSGNTVQTGLNLTFENEAQEEGRAPYASWAHKAGQPVGDYAATSGKAFDKRLGPDLIEAWDKISAAALSGDVDAGQKMQAAAKVGGKRPERQFFGER